MLQKGGEPTIRYCMSHDDSEEKQITPRIPVIDKSKREEPSS